MKKNILLFSLFLITTRTQAQVYDFPSKKLVDEFATLYNKTDPKEIFFSRITTIANSFFLIDTSMVAGSIRNVQKKYRLSLDTSANMVFDTLIYHFTQNHIWGADSSLRNNYLPFFELYNSNMCTCLTKEAQMSPQGRLEEASMNGCITALLKDTAYVNGTRRLLGHISLNELNNISQLPVTYLFQNCDAVYRYFSESIRYESVYTFLDRIKTTLSQLDNSLMKLYRAKSPELLKIFPSHKKFETDFKLSSVLLDNKQAIRFSESKENSDGSILITNTYYGHTNNKPVLYGQILYIIGDPLYASSVTSFRFIVPAKIEDKEKFMKMMEEDDILPPPPPPMEELKETWIDILRNK